MRPLLRAGLLLALPAVGVLSNLATWWGIAAGGPWDYSDAVVVPQAVAGSLYPPFQQAPYSINYYPPAIYAVDWVLGRGPDPYLLPRLFGAAALLACAWLVYLLAKELGARRLAAGAAALSFLGADILGVWPSLTNPALQAAALSLAGVLLVARKRPLAAGAVFALGVLFKQDAAVPLAAAALFFALNWDRRGLIRVLAVPALAVAPLFAALNAWTAGRFLVSVFWLPLWTPHVAPGFGGTVLLALYEAPLLVLAVFYGWRGRSAAGLAAVFVGLYALFAVSKSGASPAYLILFIALIAALYAPAFGDALRLGGRRLHALGVCLALGLLLSVSIGVPAANDPNQQVNREAALVAGVLPPGPALTDNPVINARAGAPFTFENSMFWVLEANGLWSEAPLAAQVRAGAFASVAASTDNSIFCLYPAVLAAIDASYHTVARIQGYSVLEPGPGPGGLACSGNG